jgi:hypothetical protein
MTTLLPYMSEYQNFMNEYRIAETSAETVGVLIMKLAWHYTMHNMRLAKALQAYSAIIRDFQNQTDASTGKAVSSAKAESQAAATDEASMYEEERLHSSSILEMINSLKSLQKGKLNEYAHSNA